MTSRRVFFVMLGVLGLSFVLLIGGVVAGDVLLKKQSTKLLSLKEDNQVLDEQQKAVLQAKKDIEKYADLEKIAKAIVPQDKDQAKSVREIVSLAEANGVKVVNISFPNSTLGTAVAPTTKSAYQCPDFYQP